MRRRFFRFGLLAALGSLGLGELIAQTPVVSGVWGTLLPTGLSPGVRASVKGRHFMNRDATVEIGSRQAVVLGYIYDDWDEIGAEYIIIVIPTELSAGEANIVVQTNAGSSAPFSIVLDPYAPGLFSGFFRFGKAVQCSPPGETALAGEIITANAVGLGAATSGLNSPTTEKPIITVGGQAAEVLDSVLTSEPGWYRVRFQVPSGDGYHPVVLEIGGRKSNALFLPVGNAIVSWGSPPGIAALESITTAAACGGVLSATALASDPRNPPLSLGGTTLRLRDSLGRERLAPLLYVSPEQVNYVIPAGSATGNATITIMAGDHSVSTGMLEIRTVAPQVFTVGGWVSAALLVRFRDGVQTVEPVFETNAGRIMPVPIDLGPDTDQLFLLLFGTGLRFGASVGATIGGVNAAVSYAGPQHEFPGLDQVNVTLPRLLAGRGQVEVKLTVDEDLANVSYLNFK